MSRILRRPMFRGGRVDSRGTGITSGLMDEPRVEAQKGLFLDPSFTYSAGMGLMSDPNLSMSKTPQRYLDTMDYINLTGSLIDKDIMPSIMGEAEVEEPSTAEELAKFSKDIKDLTGATFVELTQKAKEEEEERKRRLDVGGIEDFDIEKARLQQKAYEEFKKQKEAKDVESKETEPATDAQSKEDATIEAYLKAIRGDDEPEINLEDLYADRLKAAKRGDIADILLGISAGALEEGTLTGAAKGAVEAARKTGKSEVLKDQIKALETQMKIADRTGNIKQKRALEQILFAAKSKQPDFKPSEFEKRTKFLVEQGYSSDTAMRLALKQPATLEEQIQDLTKNSLTGETTPEIFQSAVRMFYMDKYKGELPIESISQDPNGTAVAEVSDGIYSDSANGNVYTVKDKVVTQIRG